MNATFAWEGDADSMRREAERLRRIADAASNAPPTMPTREEWKEAAGAAFLDELDTSFAIHEHAAAKREHEAAARAAAAHERDAARRRHEALVREYDGV